MTFAFGFPFSAATYALFVLSAATLVATPGPDTLFVLSRAVEDRRTGLHAAAGVTTGILFHTALVVVGVAAVYRTIPGAEPLIRTAGGVYLCYLGVDTFWSAGTAAPSTAGGLREGFLVNALNPQVALFFLAFLPGFVPAGAGETVPLAVLGVTYAALTAAYLGAVAVLADGAAAYLRSDGLDRLLNRVAGAVLVALGGWLLLS
ncbi:LysE family translocator [Halorubrum sp. GN11_10-6_MGM]|uniref:LysE family translocator n=1 Tax=Halorubrum sp. GN11_10-6_MGM TaxID=2518112 RepID=UPI0010F8DF21|nr:LysE family translocator [Halorubrum sp. GN11_10-6_MGM]TKX74185.1 LysE family translocator [Halorubrum sp. GN11_10-6_MGM]